MDSVLLPTNSGAFTGSIRPVLIRTISISGTTPHRTELKKMGTEIPDMVQAYDRIFPLGGRIAKKGDILEGHYIAFTALFEHRRIRMATMCRTGACPRSRVRRTNMGMRTCAVSCVANAAAGMTGQVLTHREVLDEMERASSSLGFLIEGLVSRLEEHRV